MRLLFANVPRALTVAIAEWQDRGASSLTTPFQKDADPALLTAEAHALRYTDIRGAVAVASRALEAAASAQNVDECIRALRVRSGCLARLANLTGAEDDLEEAEALLNGTENHRERGWVLLMRAQLEWRRGNHTEAVRAAERALELHRSTPDPAGEAEALLGLGMLAESTNDEARALHYYHASRSLCERTHDTGGLAAATMNIGSVYGRLDDPERATAEFVSALPLCVEVGNRTLEARLLANLATEQSSLGRDELALEYGTRGLSLAQELGDRRVEMEARVSIALIYLKSREVAKAQEILTEALATCLSMELASNEASVRLELGRVFLMREEHEAARVQFEAALATGEAIGSNVAYEGHELLATLYQAAGNFQLALYHERKYHALKDSIWGAKAHQRIRAALIDAEVQRADDDARRLREHNDALRSINEEKTQLLATLTAQTDLLARLSTEDGLTGAYNRRHLDVRLDAEWQRSSRFGHPLAFALLDVDHFKSINDQHSHAVGDDVLRAITAHLRSRTRQVDLVARYGGEEFAIIFVATSLKDAAIACESLRSGIAGMDWSSVANGLTVTVSIGVAAANEVSSVSALMALADARLYGAKRCGRNLVKRT